MGFDHGFDLGMNGITRTVGVVSDIEMNHQFTRGDIIGTGAGLDV